MTKTIDEILKDYHCWHTLQDCEGCDLKERCNKETITTKQDLLSVLIEGLPEIKGIETIQNSYTEGIYEGYNRAITDCQSSLRKQLKEKK